MGDYYDIGDADDGDYYRRIAAAEKAHRESMRSATKQALQRELQYRAIGWLGELALLLAAWAAWWWLLVA
jgi:hypothetical protein